MEKLTEKKCEPCEGGVAPLNEQQYGNYLGQVKEWKVVEGKKLERDFKSKDFKAALAFINAVGAVAEEEGHHPDILLYGWNKTHYTLLTHAIGGLSLNDFILAAKIDEVWSRLNA